MSLHVCFVYVCASMCLCASVHLRVWAYAIGNKGDSPSRVKRVSKQERVTIDSWLVYKGSVPGLQPASWKPKRAMGIVIP